MFEFSHPPPCFLGFGILLDSVILVIAFKFRCCLASERKMFGCISDLCAGAKQTYSKCYWNCLLGPAPLHRRGRCVVLTFPTRLGMSLVMFRELCLFIVNVFINQGGLERRKAPRICVG